MDWASAWGKRWGRKPQPASVHFRVLSTAELGANRYAECAASKMWPVEVRFRDGEARLARPSAFVSRANNHAKEKTEVTIAETITNAPQARESLTGWWIVYALVPAGPVTFTMLDDDSVVATGNFEVAGPAQKSTRHSPPQSGATVERDRVVFRFADPGSNIRTIYLESPFIRQPVPMVRDRGTDGEFFVGYAKMPPGKFDFRFRVLLKETTRPNAAPFTTLGWDPEQGYAGGLTTWEQSVVIQPGMGGSQKSNALDVNRPKKEIRQPIVGIQPDVNVVPADTDSPKVVGNPQTNDSSSTRNPLHINKPPKVTKKPEDEGQPSVTNKSDNTGLHKDRGSPKNTIPPDVTVKKNDGSQSNTNNPQGSVQKGEDGDLPSAGKQPSSPIEPNSEDLPPDDSGKKNKNMFFMFWESVKRTASHLVNLDSWPKPKRKVSELAVTFVAMFGTFLILSSDSGKLKDDTALPKDTGTELVDSSVGTISSRDDILSHSRGQSY